MSKQQADPAYIAKVLNYLCAPGQVVELRAISGDRRGTISGYFNDLNKMAVEAAKLSGTVPAVYFTPNPVKAAMLSRAANRLRERVKDGETTGDQHILKRTKFLLDFDSTPENVSGISSTDEGHETAISRAREVKEWLEKDLKFPPLLLADSGNGGHLMGELDLANTPENTEILKKCLEAIALRFEDKEIKVDQKIFNAARIWKLYDTWACKGDETEDRHHRQAKVISWPEELNLIPLEQIVRLASLVPQNPKPEFSTHKTDFNIEDWISKSGLDIALSAPWQQVGWKWILRTCPWNPDHTNRSAYILRLPSGAIDAGCHHDGCTGKGWHDLRDVVEPGRRESRSNGSYNSNGASSEAKKRTPLIIKVSEVRREEVSWLCHNRIPRKKISLFDGDPGQGKSFLTQALAASVSCGFGFPGEEQTIPSRVILMSAEDGAEDTIRPRLEDMGANLECITLLRGMVDADGKEKFLTLEDLDNRKRDLPS